MNNDLFRKAAILGLSLITAIGLSGAVFAPTAHAQLSSSQVDSIISLLQSFGADQNTINNVRTSLEGGTPSGGTGSTGGSSGSTPACDFNRSLSQGDTGADVMCLQQYLNNTGYTVSASGVGSPGNETEYFGTRTKQAVVAWQNANATDVLQPVGLSNGTGYWGPSSIAHYNKVAVSAGSGGSTGGSTGGSVSTPDSGVNVSAESMSDITVPRNATLVEVGKFTFASGENTDIETLSFQRKGAGQRTDWDKLYIYNGSTRIGSGRTINTDQGVSFSNLNVDLDDGEVKTLTLRGTVSSSNSGNVHYFSLTSVGFDDNTTASGLPVMSRTVTLANATVGSLDVDHNVPVDTTVELGDNDVELFNGNFVASTEDMDLKSVILTQYGTVEMDDLDNYSVKVDSSTVDADIDASGDEVTITFDGDGYFIEEGDNVEIALYADMTSGAYIKGGAGTIELNVDENNDVKAVGRDFGYGVNITHGTAFGNPSGTTNQVTIQASELNFSFNGPQTADIGLNAEDVVLFDFDAVTQADIEVDNMSFKFDINGSNSLHLRNLKLINKDTGKVYAGPDEIASTTTDVNHNFDDVFVIPAGSHTLQVVADVGNNTMNGAEVTVSLLVDASGTSNDLDAENLDTSENIDITTDVIPAGELAGKKQTFTQPDLTISNSPNPTAQTYVVGKSNAVLGAYVLEASDVSSIDVRQLQVRLSEDSSTSTIAELSGSVSLRKGSADGTVLSSKSVSSGSGAKTVSFDTSGKLKLAAGAQEVVYVTGDIKSDFDAGAGDVSATSSISSVTAKDAESNNPLFNGVTSFSDVNGTTFTIGTTGSFDAVAFSGNNPSENRVITPGGDVLFASYRLRPSNEDLQMRDFVVTIADSSNTSYYNRIKAFFNGVQKGGDQVITGASKTFDNVNVDLAKDTDTTVDLKATLNSISSNLTSGEELQLYLSTTTTNYDIIGKDSGAAVTFTTSSIDTAAEGLRTFQVANAYPTFAYTGSDATLSAGNKTLYKFTVTANNGDVHLRKISFDVDVNEASSSTNLRVGTFTLERSDKSGTIGTATTTDSDTDGTIGDAGDSTGSESASTTISISNVSDYTVASGSTVTFTLKGSVNGVASDDANSISVTMNNDDEDITFARGSNSTDTSIAGATIWGDTYRTFNGVYLDFPTDSQTLSL